MNLYLLTPDTNYKYDTYDSAVVCADNEEEARYIHPNGWQGIAAAPWNGKAAIYDGWVDADKVKVAYIGIASAHLQKGVIVASFNAG